MLVPPSHFLSLANTPVSGLKPFPFRTHQLLFRGASRPGAPGLLTQPWTCPTRSPLQSWTWLICLPQNASLRQNFMQSATKGLLALQKGARPPPPPPLQFSYFFLLLLCTRGIPLDPRQPGAAPAAPGGSHHFHPALHSRERIPAPAWGPAWGSLLPMCGEGWATASRTR